MRIHKSCRGTMGQRYFLVNYPTADFHLQIFLQHPLAILWPTRCSCFYLEKVLQYKKTYTNHIQLFLAKCELNMFGILDSTSNAANVYMWSASKCALELHDSLFRNVTFEDMYPSEPVITRKLSHWFHGASLKWEYPVSPNPYEFSMK